MNRKTEWITKTAVMLALLVALQAATKGFGQLVTGSCVNFVLAAAALVCPISGAVTVAALSPFFAFLLGIGPAFFFIVPGIAAGNVLYVVLLHSFAAEKSGKLSAKDTGLAVLVPSLCKAAALYLLIVKLILPLLGLNAKQMAVLGAVFSWPQLVTALVGSVSALLLYPRLAPALKAMRH